MICFYILRTKCSVEASRNNHQISRWCKQLLVAAIHDISSLFQWGFVERREETETYLSSSSVEFAGLWSPECWTLSQDHLPALTVTASRETQTFDHLKKNLSYSRLHNNTTLLSCGGSEPPWVTADSLWSSHSGPFQWESRVKPTGSSTRQLQRQTVLVCRGMIFENCPAQMQSIILSRGQVSAQ